MEERTKQHKHMKMKIKKNNKNSFSSLKRRSNVVFDNEVELNVAQILIQLHHLIAQSESRWLHRFPFPFNWSVKRKRSALNSPSLSSSPPSPLPPPPIQPPTTTADVATELKPTTTTSASTSPTTPLSLFSHNESNDKLVKLSIQHQGKKREELLEMVNELTQCRILLKQEVETERYRHKKLKAINSELKLKKNELICGVKIKPHIERNEIMNLIIPKFKPTDTANQNHTQFKQQQQHQQQQQQQQHLPLYNNKKDRDFGIVKRRGSMTTTTTGIHIPDLNASVKHDGTSSIEFLRFQQHFDFRANIISKAMAAAEARKRRRQIYKGKNKTHK